MKGNPEHTRVLYGNIESQSLQKIANGITQSFVDAGKSVEHYNSFDKKKFNFSMYYTLGLAKKEDDAVKLHMTVMNVKYLKSKNSKIKSFNATHILERFADFEFGSQEVNKVYLASMREKDPDGFYKCIASAEF